MIVIIFFKYEDRNIIRIDNVRRVNVEPNNLLHVEIVKEDGIRTIPYQLSDIAQIQIIP